MASLQMGSCGRWGGAGVPLSCGGEEAPLPLLQSPGQAQRGDRARRNHPGHLHRAQGAMAGGMWISVL